MPSKQVMRTQSNKHSQYVTKRGAVPKSLKPESDKSPIGPYLIALFVFVVCGSGKPRAGTPDHTSVSDSLDCVSVGACGRMVSNQPVSFPFLSSAIFQIIQSIRMS